MPKRPASCSRRPMPWRAPSPLPRSAHRSGRASSTGHHSPCRVSGLGASGLALSPLVLTDSVVAQAGSDDGAPLQVNAQHTPGLAGSATGLVSGAASAIDILLAG